MKNESRPPDFILKVKNMDTKQENRVGAGWKTEDGKSIRIHLDYCVVLKNEPGLIFTLFKKD